MPFLQVNAVYGMPQAQPGWPGSVPQAPPPARVAMPSPPPTSKLTLPPAPVLAAEQGKAKVRAVAEDEPAPPARPAPPTRIVLPSPDELGIKIEPASTMTATAAVDWNQVHARLETLGIVQFQRERLPQGGFRVVLALPTRQVEAVADTEAAAMLQALERAEQGK